MNIVPIQYSYFDDNAIRAMGAEFDQAYRSLRHFAHLNRVRELVAKRIIEAAKNGERESDPPPFASSNGVQHR